MGYWPPVDVFVRANSWSTTVLCEKLIVPQLWTKFPAIHGTLKFLNVSSQLPATYHCPEPGQFSLHLVLSSSTLRCRGSQISTIPNLPRLLLREYFLIVPFHLRLNLPSDHFPSTNKGRSSSLGFGREDSTSSLQNNMLRNGLQGAH
jgi:hypothetical protein